MQRHPPASRVAADRRGRLLRAVAAIVLLLCGFAGAAPAVPPQPTPAPTFQVPTTLTQMAIGAPLQVLRGHAAKLDAAAVASLPQARFAPATESRAIAGGPVWLRIALQRSPQSPRQLVVQLGRPLWRTADGYLVTGNGGAQRVEPLEAVPTRLAAFAVSPPTGPSTLVLRVAPYEVATPVVRLWDAHDFRRYSDDDVLLQGLLFGMMLALLIHNALLFARTRDAAHLAFVFWLSAAAFYLLGETGLGQFRFWPGATPWNDVSLYAGLMFGSAGALLFARTYLLLPASAPAADRTLQVAQWLALALAVVEVVPHNAWLSIPTHAVAAAALLLVTGAAALRWRQGFRPATILLAGLAPAVAVCGGEIARDLGWLADAAVPGDARQWAFALLALVATYGLAVRGTQLRDRTDRAVSPRPTRDPLTGLFNRNGLFEEGQRVLDRTRASHAVAAVLWFDLDGLRRVNSRFGHTAGDALIQATSARLRDAFGPEAVCARLGGGEFGVILPNLPSAQLVAELTGHALERLHAPYALSGEAFRASGSIGVALYPDDASTLGDLLRLAEAAMRGARARGRDPLPREESPADAGSPPALFGFPLPPRRA